MKQLLIFFLFSHSWLQAQVYEFNTQLLGQWNGAGESYSDVWGYSSNGREYAILGSARYIYFFDVTNPASIRLVDKFGPYTSTSWREFKTYRHYAYAVTDGPDAGGLRIFDLQFLPDRVVQIRQTTAFFSKCHMPFIDEANGRLYCAGTDTRNNGIIVLDLSVRPDSPSMVINQALPRGYVHDVYVRNNVVYASHIYSGYLSQYDCTGNSCSGELSTFQTGGYNHSSYMNADQSLLINAIETAGHPLWLFPINSNGTIENENYKQFKSATLKDQYPSIQVGEGSIGHNPYITGDRAYVSYYTDGVQVYNISDVNNIRRVAYFDTDRGYTSYSPVFRGCWGTYPFFSSGNILASDIQSGLWIFKTTACAGSQPPAVNLTSAASAYAGGSSFKITANTNDADGSPVKVEFYNKGEVLGIDTDFPFEYTIAQAGGTGYSFTAKVYDDCGISSLSPVLAIGILPSCTDGIQNGDETGIDCGGSCSLCSLGCTSPINLSQGKSTSQSSNYNGSNSYPSSRAVDGSITNFNHTNTELQPWWQVDLGSNYQVSNIEISNRKDCCGNRIKRMRVFVSSSPITSYSTSGYVYEYNNATGMTNGQIINIPNLLSNGRYVRIWVDNTGYGNNYLHLGEVKVFGCSSTVDPCVNNQTPSVSISSNSTSYIQGTAFTIDAIANDAGGSISRVDFYNGTNLLGTDNTSPYSYTVSPATENTYSITARAIDNCNSSTTSNPMTISMTNSCSDGIKNGDETGIDCGGSCSPCSQGCTSPVNLSQGKSTSQSSNYNGSNSYPSSRAVDGSITNFNHTNTELQPWWQVDLGSNYQVSNIEISNRKDCCGNRIKRMRVFVSSSPVTSYSTSGYVYEYNNATGMTNGQVINIPNLSSTGRYVRIWVDNTGYGNNYLHLADVKVQGCSISSSMIHQEISKEPFGLNSDEAFILFPNPTHESINLQFKIQPEQEVTYLIYNLQGRLLRKGTVIENRIHLADLEAGSYFLHFQSHGKTFWHKVIKI